MISVPNHAFFGLQILNLQGSYHHFRKSTENLREIFGLSPVQLTQSSADGINCVIDT